MWQVRASAREADFEANAAKAKAKRCRKETKAEPKAQPKKRTRRAAKEQSELQASGSQDAQPAGAPEEQDQVPTENVGAAGSSSEPELAAVPAVPAAAEENLPKSESTEPADAQGDSAEKPKRQRKARTAPTKEVVKAAWALKELLFWGGP